MFANQFRNLLLIEGYPISEDYINGIRAISNDEYERLSEAMRLADRLRAPYNKLASIKWSLYAFKGGELPFPHTHGRHIMLPAEWIYNQNETNVSQTAKTLIHELIHIFQRYYPVESNALLVDSWGVRLVGFGKSLLRNNPDLNWIKYADHGDSEHPFELMAYRLADIIMQDGGGNDYLKMYM